MRRGDSERDVRDEKFSNTYPEVPVKLSHGHILPNSIFFGLYQLKIMDPMCGIKPRGVVLQEGKPEKGFQKNFKHLPNDSRE